MTSVFCEQCRAPVSDAAKFCLRCGSRTGGRRPTKPFKFLSLLFFVLAGAVLSALLLRLAPRTASRTSAGSSGNRSNTAPAGLDRDATVLADSFCSESDTQIMQLYALIAQGDRNGAAAPVLCELTLLFGGPAHRFRQLRALAVQKLDLRSGGKCRSFLVPIPAARGRLPQRCAG
jgi:hypothetical protein